MPHVRATCLLVAGLLSLAGLSALGQAPSLTVSASPTGELVQLADAAQVRIVFSEPMVPLGSVPPGPAPSWLRISPSASGSFYWSGTKTLIFSPGASTPLPFATTFTVHVDASVSSVSGRTLAAPYTFTFTTPTVRLLAAQWYRKGGRFDSPAVLALRFNQPVRSADVVAHTGVALVPHAWVAPQLSAPTRAWWRRSNRAGLRAFDAKVAAVRRATSSAAPLAVRVADTWDERRFPPAAELVVLETEAAPPTDGWLRITMDGSLPSPAGPEVHAAHSATVTLDPTFFASSGGCDGVCVTSAYSDLMLTGRVSLAAFGRALTVVDVTNTARLRPVAASRPVDAEGAEEMTADAPRLTALGFDEQAPVTTWRMRLDPDLQAGDGQTLGYAWLGFNTGLHKAPFVTLPGSVWEAGGGRLLPLSARNVTSIRQGIARVEPASVLRRLLDLEDDLFPWTDTARRRLTGTPDAVQAHPIDIGRLLSPGGTGLVWTAVDSIRHLPHSERSDRTAFDYSNGRARGTLVQVTNLGITVKDGADSTLVFVTGLDTGAPLPDVRVAIVDNTGATRWSGTTGRDGVAMAPALAFPEPKESRTLLFIVTAEKAGDFAFLDVGSGSGNHPLAHERLQGAAGILRGRVFTDRGVYKQAEEVHLKAVVRLDTSAGMRMLPAGTRLEIRTFNSQALLVDRREIAVSRWSSVEWTWRVPDDATLGPHRVAVSRASSSSQAPEINGSFLVAAFRRPDFRVGATLEGDPPVLGSTLHGTVDAHYLFGGPMGGRPVRWRYTREPVRRVPGAVLDRYPEARYAVGYLPDDAAARRLYTYSEPKTDPLRADGRMSIDLATSAEPDVAYLYTLEGDVADVSGQYMANRTSLVVHPASLYLAVSRPPMFVETSAGATVGLAAIDLAGRSVTALPMHVSLVREQWIRGPGRAGEASTGWERRDTPAGEWSVPSAAGETSLPIPLREPGSYILRATARDDAGRQTRTELRFYALGSGFAPWHGESDTIQLTPERTTWKPGEAARILIRSPWDRATALVTVEREGVRSHRTFTIASTQDTIDVPITEADVPNVFVSVLLVKGRTSNVLEADGGDPGRPAYRVGGVELTVDEASKRLGIAVSTDRTEYRPRQPVTVSVAVAAPGGRAAESEVTFWAVDAGLLSLTGYTTPDLLKAIYLPKPLQVATEDSRQHLLPRGAMPAPGLVSGGVEGGIPGGTIGGVVGPITVDGADDVRRDFRPLVFWLGSAAAGADGRVTTTVTLPDSLTTYRIMAVAGNDASQFGFGEHEIRVTRPLTLLPAFPRFLGTGDRASFGAVVTNTGGFAGSAIVTIRSLDPAMLQFSDASRTIRLEPGVSQAVRFDAVAARAGEARVRITVALGEDADALDMPLTVRSSMPRQTTAAYGETAGTATERLVLPAGVLADSGGLSVELASTALVGLGEPVRYLVEYPHECAEQKSSRALALLLTSDLGGAFKLSGVNPGDERARAARALAELSAFQCRSGGFALWPGQCGAESAYLTAYVLHVMNVAGTQRVTVDAGVIGRALDYLEQNLREDPPANEWRPVWAASQAYSVTVLAEFGRKPEAAISRLAGMAERLPIFALSYLADALAATNDRGPRYQDLLRRMTNALRIDADEAHVEEVDDEALGWLWSSNVRATAVVLEGLARRHDDPAMTAPLARWLLGARRNGRWATTHENASVLEAFAAYYPIEAEVPRMTAAVSVGTLHAGDAAFSGRSTTAQTISVSMAELLTQVREAARPPDGARAGAIDGARTGVMLSIARTGTGRLYYNARLQSYAPEPREAVDRGFSVTRRYEPYVPDAPGATPAPSSAPARAPSSAMVLAQSRVAAPASSSGVTSFTTGDLIRVTVTLTVRSEGRYLAVTDPLPAGFEPLDSSLQTTASDLAREGTSPATESWRPWRYSGIDHIEKHDDRVTAFATWLAPGRHELSYLVRATTPGTFGAPGARVEAMYAPEVSGRSEAATVRIANR